ncbi:hypothetical protein JXA88_13750, partial [Candidatus Fermentibacteria bacterium]|nr:hypothetical protein [Candidatus Fermentibacteria bacterium]
MTAGRHDARTCSLAGIWVVVTAAVLLGTAHQVFGIPWPVAPQNSAHAINKTYGDWNGYVFAIDTIPATPTHPEQYLANIRYHTGVDIPKDSGTAVLAVFGGYVTAAQTFTGNQVHLSYITIARTMAGNPSWHYGHVIPRPDLGRDSTVSSGDVLGWVAPFRPNLENCHLHFYLEEEVGNLTRSVCNPLDSLVPAPSQNVEFAPRPAVGRHNYAIDYVKDRRETIQLAQTFWDSTRQEYVLKDSADIVVGAVAVTGGNYDPGIYGIGYSVSPVDTGGTIPYRCMLMMRGPFEMADSLAYYATFVDPETSPIDWPLCRYIVTNCGESAPSVTKGISNIEENCWPTRVDTSGTGTATRNEEARFPDGWYDVFLDAWSHSGDTAAVHDTVFVDNFAPPVNRALVRQTRGTRDSTVVYDAHWEGDELAVETDEPVRLVQGDVLEVELLFSEGMHDTIRVTLEGPYAGLPFETVRWDSVVHPRDRWVGRYPLVTWDSVRNLMAGDRRLVIWAEDAVTRHALDANPGTAAYWDADTEEWVGYEGDDGLPGQTGGHDRVHRLQIEPFNHACLLVDASSSMFLDNWYLSQVRSPQRLVAWMMDQEDSADCQVAAWRFRSGGTEQIAYYGMSLDDAWAQLGAAYPWP